MAHLWPIFPTFRAKKFLLENPALSHTISYGFLAPCQNLEKTNHAIPRKSPDRRKDEKTDGRMEGWKDGRMEGWKDGWRGIRANASGSKILNKKYKNMTIKQ